MAAASFLKYFCLASFSKPAGQRPLYRAVRRHRARSIVQLGVGDLQLAQRLIQVAQRYATADVIYTGIDLFEARTGNGGLTLKRAHQLLAGAGAKVKLVPGGPFDALSRTANALTGTDLVIVSRDQDAEQLQRAWFYVPRLLHQNSLVYLQQPGEGDDAENSYRTVPHDEIDRLAAQHDRRKAA